MFQSIVLPRRCLVPCLIGLASVALACEDRDATSVTAPGGSGGSGAAGSSGSGSGGTSLGGSAGSNAGNGGSAGTDLDAGTDADAASAGDGCVLSTLAEYCGVLECPALADARGAFRGTTIPFLRAIVQRPCAAVNGAARIAVTGHFWAWTRTYIYDAATEQLVGVEYIDDVGCPWPSGSADDPTEPGFGYYTGFYGEASPDCSSGGLALELPAGCVDAGAALEDWEPSFDAGAPYECVIAP